MTSPNVELVQSIHEAWGRGDFSSVEWADPDIEFVLPDGPDPGRWKGVEQMGQGWRSRLRAWEDVRYQPDEYRELGGDRVLVLSHGSGRGKTSGVSLEQVTTEGATLFQIRGGKVTKLVAYFDSRNAFTDLGLSE